MPQQHILDQLNPAQLAAVTHVDGPLLTLAGPGSGKTRVVTHRIAYLLEQGISPYSILALTFTNKAAQEMKSRVAKLSQDAPVWMGTFHGYCARFVRRYGQFVGISPNFSIFDADDSKKALESAIAEAGVSLTHLNFGDIHKGISSIKNRAITPEMMVDDTRSHTDKILGKIYPVYQEFLQRNNAVDFDDLLLHTATILRSSPELRSELDEKHRYILVDEYQDTNLCQYLIVRALSIEHPNLNVTGDPDQSVYGWRGADISNILNFERDYPNVTTIRLEQNYRSTPQILSAADALICHNSRRKAKVLVPTRPDGDRIRLVTYRTARDEADDIAQQIATAVLEKRSKAKDFAILYRTNAQSRLLEQALLRCKLNYQLIGGFRFYHRQEVKDLLGYLRLVHNPTDDISFERVINTPTRGLGDKSLSKVRELAKAREIPLLVALRAAVTLGSMSNKASSGAKEFLALYDDLVQLSTGQLVPLMNHLLKKTDYVSYLSKKKSEAPDDSVQGNIDELISDAAEVDRSVEDGNSMETFLEQVSLLSDVDGLDGKGDQVTLMTLHSAKGLEFEHVFVIAVEENVLPHIRSRYDMKQMEEERRLFFVGITRARDRLQLSLAKSRGFSSSNMGAASQFLMELPRAEMEIVDYSEYNMFDDNDSDFEDHVDEWSDALPKAKPKKPDPFYSPSNWKRNQDKTRNKSTWEIGDSSAEIISQEIDESYSQEESPEDDKGTSIESNEVIPFEAAIAKLKRVAPSLQLKTGSQIDGTRTTSGELVDRFRPGQLVSHPVFGQGTVASLDGKGLKRMIRVEFESGDVKSFQLNMSPLAIVS